MEVAVQEPVAVGKGLEALEGAPANVLGDERRPEPVPQVVAQLRQPRGRLDAVQRRMLDSEDPGHRPQRPRPGGEPAEQIGTVDAVEDDTRSAVHRDALVDARYVRAGAVRCRQRDHLALDHPAVGRIPREPEHPPVVPGKDLGLAPRSEQFQVAGRHRVRS